MDRILILLDVVFVTLYISVMAVLYYMGRLPTSIRPFDFVLLGLAAARLTDIISTDQIMQWLRRPFVKMETTEIAGHEVETRTGRGRGLKKVLGDLLSCPWCVGVWVAASLTYAYFLMPTVTWIFILILAIAEIGSLVQTLSTIMVSIEKYCKGLGAPEEGP